MSNLIRNPEKGNGEKFCFVFVQILWETKALSHLLGFCGKGGLRGNGETGAGFILDAKIKLKQQKKTIMFK